MTKTNPALTIEPKKSLWDFRLKELWDYRYLVFLFVKRDFVAVYKQTILGPIWFFLQPILTTIIFTVVFGNFGKMSTDGIPAPLFYLSGLVIWNYFSESLLKTSETFIRNQTIFGKVYFPRLVMPLSIVISNLLKLGIQLLLLAAVYTYFYFTGNEIQLNSTIFLFPFLIIVLSFLGLGAGIIFSALTTKYRDLVFLLQFGVQLLMFISSVVIPLSQIPSDKQWFFRLNPMLNIIESFKFALFGSGEFSWFWLGYSAFFSIVFLAFGIIMFNRIERSFMDTI